MTKSGGYRVATDEVFALEAHARQSADLAHELASALGLVLTRWGDGELQAARVATARSAEALASLAGKLRRYSEDVAGQEHTRATWWGVPRDRAVAALVSVAMGDSSAASAVGGWRQALLAQPRLGWGSLRGAAPDSVIDDAAATVLLGVAGYDPEVTVSRVEAGRPTRISSSVAERIGRIPEAGSPVRIERYELPDGSTHTEVFVAGTTQWSLSEGDNPFDMRSNLALVAGIEAASVMATEQAMSQAGVRQGESVLFVGHSQGGAVAATLANSGRYTTVGLITAGAPTGTLPVRESFPAIVIEHRDDVVPALSGARVPTQAIVVEADSQAGVGDIRDAHSRNRYLTTARQIDRSPDSDLSGFSDAFPHGAWGVASVFGASQKG